MSHACNTQYNIPRYTITAFLQSFFGLVSLSSVSSNSPYPPVIWASPDLFYNVNQPYKYAIFGKFKKFVIPTFIFTVFFFLFCFQ